MQLVTFTAFWLRRIAGALYATLPDRRVNAAVLLGLAWKKPRSGFTRHFRSLTCFVRSFSFCCLLDRKTVRCLFWVPPLTCRIWSNKDCPNHCFLQHSVAHEPSFDLSHSMKQSRAEPVLDIPLAYAGGLSCCFCCLLDRKMLRGAPLRGAYAETCRTQHHKSKPTI